MARTRAARSGLGAGSVEPREKVNEAVSYIHEQIPVILPLGREEQ